MADLRKYAVLDLETRFNLALAREVLRLGPDVPREEVLQKLAEKRHGDKNGDFQKLPYHEPVAAALLLAEWQGAAPQGPLVATDWYCWKAGDLPVEGFVERFFQLVAGRTYVGFNSQNFDLPLMELWASRCGVSAPDHFGREVPDSPRYKYALELHCDLQKELVNFAWGSGTFDELCKFHGLPGKPGVSGGDVEVLAGQRRFDEIQAYNVTDVLQSWLLFLHTAVRSGRLTRASAGASARGSLALTRSLVCPRLSEPASRALLEGSLEACARAPIAREAAGRAEEPEDLGE